MNRLTIRTIKGSYLAHHSVSIYCHHDFLDLIFLSCQLSIFISVILLFLDDPGHCMRRLKNDVGCNPSNACVYRVFEVIETTCASCYTCA